MSRRPWFILGALLCLAAGRAHGQSAPKGYDVYNLVKTRNIFDPSRKAVRLEPPGELRQKDRNRPSYFTLTGTMVAEGRSLAFFSGSRTEFSRVVPIGEVVAGYKVVAITPLQAEVERDGKSLVMAVGHRLQLDGLTDEVPVSETPSPDGNSAPSSNPSDPNAPASTSTGAAPAPSVDKAEILRRMMERRQKEMSK